VGGCSNLAAEGEGHPSSPSHNGVFWESLLIEVLSFPRNFFQHSFNLRQTKDKNSLLQRKRKEKTEDKDKWFSLGDGVGELKE
jgi:hypothetical protein